MSKVAEKVADSLYRKDYISEEEKEIYSYGYEILIDNIGKTFLLLMVGAIIHQLVATLIFVVVFTTLRSCCGGYHASKAWQCNLLTVVLWGMVIAGTYTEAVMKKCETLTIEIAVVSELVIYQCAPVEHQNKKLTNEKKVRNRRCALGLGMIYGILILLLTFSLTRLAIALALTVLEVVILMIIPSEGRSNEP